MINRLCFLHAMLYKLIRHVEEGTLASAVAALTTALHAYSHSAFCVMVDRCTLHIVSVHDHLSSVKRCQAFGNDGPVCKNGATCWDAVNSGIRQA